jgi:uncharacterized membrane protein
MSDGLVMKLSEQEKSGIRELAVRVEARTGVQVMAVVTGKSDTYPEIPWKAFSLGAVLAMLAAIAAASLGHFPGRNPLLLWGIPVLGTGIVLALAAIFLHPVSRLFLGRYRAAEETKQFAQSLFLERGLSRTASRKAILVLVSQFERCASIVPDTRIMDRIPASEFDSITAGINAALAWGSASKALAEGLTALEQLLLRHGFAAAGSPDEISQEFLETEGPKP